MGVDIAVFLFAASPLADDVLYIPLGAMGYGLPRFLASVFAEKIVLSSISVLLSASTADLFVEHLGNVTTAALMAIITTLFTLAASRVKWSRVLAAYDRGGAKYALLEAVRSMLGLPPKARW
ncbi:MAG: hypothetical protein QXP98_00250 [Thermoproteus sp.]